MILARIFTKIFKEGGIILIDAKGQKYIFLKAEENMQNLQQRKPMNFNKK